MNLTVPIEIPTERVQDLLICAFEGGSNYWYRDLHVVSDVDVVGKVSNIHRYPIVPTTPGGEIGFYADSDGNGPDDPDNPILFTLDLDKVTKGLGIMAHTYPQHWANFIAYEDDAETGDVFLQCCVFGEIVYG